MKHILKYHEAKTFPIPGKPKPPTNKKSKKYTEYKLIADITNRGYSETVEHSIDDINKILKEYDKIKNNPYYSNIRIEKVTYIPEEETITNIENSPEYTEYSMGDTTKKYNL